MATDMYGVAGEDRLDLVRRLEHDLARAADPFREASVVVVDDEPSNVELLTELLQMAGVSRVHGLTDGRLAVETCLAVEPDLLLLDLKMPSMDGHAVLEALGRALPPDEYLPVLVLSGDTSPTARQRALGAGAKDFVTKPFDRVEVIQRARNLLETRALYLSVRNRNQELLTQLAAQAEEGRRRELDLARRRQEVEAILAGSRFRTVFQPIVELRGGRTVAVEALCRFDAGSDRPPNTWFAQAAEVGLGVELEVAVVEAAVAQIDRLPDTVMLSVNVSPEAATSSATVRALRRAPTGRVVAELTEHSRIPDYRRLLASLAELREMGVAVAVDDAGAAYAGLQQILSLRPDIIKLDLVLTRGIDADPVRRAMAASMVRFADEVGAVLVAEGIETAGELDVLRRLGVLWGQGFHLGTPRPMDQLTPALS